MERLTNNGNSSTPKTGRENQLRDNGTETMDSLLTWTSILFPLLEEVDTLTILAETLSLRLKMVEQAKDGTSISLQELLDPDQLISQSTSITPVNPTTCNTTLPHQDGGKCSSSRTDTSPTSRMVRRSPFPEVKMKKLNQFGYTTSTKEDIHLRFGELSTPTRWEKTLTKRLEKLIHSLDSWSIHNSTSDQSSQCKELLNVLVQAILLLRNGTRIEKPRNGDSTLYPRLSRT
jgi:hypothetical protein